MSANNQYYSSYNRKIFDAGKDYVNSKCISILLDRFYISADTEQGKSILKVLKDSQLLLDPKYINIDLSFSADYSPTCCVCAIPNYPTWKLIGITVDTGMQVIKCVLPHVMCEKCFRKRFCYQIQTPYLCGIAVLHPSDYSSLLIASHLIHSDGYKENVSQNRNGVVSSPPIVNTEVLVTPSVRHLQVESLPVVLLPKQEQEPIPVAPQPSVAVEEINNYGVDDVLGESRQSDHDSVSSPSQLEPAMCVEQVADETVFTLPYRQGGFFRTWLSAYFVITPWSIRMYPNEKRNDRKMKEILLYDASVAHSAISSDSKHPFCVSIQPGPISERKKAFVVAMESQTAEQEFIATIEQYIAMAQENPPESPDADQVE